MNKVQTRTWAEARAELARIASAHDCEAFDHAVAQGRKVAAVKLLRGFGISVYQQ